MVINSFQQSGKEFVISFYEKSCMIMLFYFKTIVNFLCLNGHLKNSYSHLKNSYYFKIVATLKKMCFIMQGIFGLIVYSMYIVICCVYFESFLKIS